MNSKQRRARIRAGMPNALRRLSTLCLMGEIDPKYAADIRAILDDPQLQLYRFELAVRGIAGAERQAEMNRTLKTYITSRTGRTQSNTPVLQTLPRTRFSQAAIDEVTQIK